MTNLCGECNHVAGTHHPDCSRHTASQHTNADSFKEQFKTTFYSYAPMLLPMAVLLVLIALVKLGEWMLAASAAAWGSK